MGFGCESFVTVHYTGFMDGDCPGNLSLGQYTGDGKFDGETFLGRSYPVRRGCCFLGGTGEGKRKSQDKYC